MDLEDAVNAKSFREAREGAFLRYVIMAGICDSLRDLYLGQLRELFSAEVLLVRSLPRIADGATAPVLRQAFLDQLANTRVHVARLEQIFEELSPTAPSLACDAVSAILGETERYLEAGGDSDVRDAGLIAAARKFLHYKAASCAAARAMALRLSDTGAAEILAASLDDERNADEGLAKIAETSVNVNAGNRIKTKADFDVSIF